MSIDNTGNTTDLSAGTDVAPAPVQAPVNPKQNSFRTIALIAVTAVMIHLATRAFHFNVAAIVVILVVFLGVAYFFTKYVGDDNEDKPAA